MKNTLSIKNIKTNYFKKFIGILFAISLLFIMYFFYLRPYHLEYSVVNSIIYKQRSLDYDKIKLNKTNYIILSDSRFLNLKLKNINSVNLSIGGETSNTLNNRVKNYNFRDSISIILCIGLNDVLFSYGEEKIKMNLEKLFDHLSLKTKNSDLYICEILPINADGFFFNKENVNATISNLNLFFDTINLKNNNRKKIIHFSALSDLNSGLKSEYTYDGIHLNSKGIENVKSVLEKAIINE